MDEKYLIARAKQDSQAFGRLYELYNDRISDYIKARVTDKTTVEDIVSDTWLKILGNIHRYNDQGTSFAAWAFTIARNTINDYYRQRRVTVSLQQAGEHLVGVEAPRDNVLFTMELDRMLQTLPESQREAILLRYGADLKVQDIAQMLGKSQGAVKARLTRALRRLREEMKQKKQRARIWKQVGSIATALIIAIGVSLLFKYGPLPFSKKEHLSPHNPSAYTFQADTFDAAGEANKEEGAMMIMTEENPDILSPDSGEDLAAAISQAEAVEIAKQQVAYPAKVLAAEKVELDDRLYWRITLVRDGMGIPNRDTILVDMKTGEPTIEMSAQ